MRDTTFKDKRRLYDIYDYLGITDKAKRVIVCPMPNHVHVNHTPSFSIYQAGNVQRFICHGSCGKRGDVIDLAGYLNIPGYDENNPEQVKEALALLAGKCEISIPEERTKTASLRGDLHLSYLPLKADGLAYLAQRGISQKTAEHFMIGQDGNYVTIPALENRVLKTIKKRNLINEGLRYFSVKGSATALFNHDYVSGAGNTVFIVKGEIAAMVLHERGLYACAGTAGEGTTKPEWLLPIVFAQKRVVIGDNDIQGKNLEGKTKERAGMLKAELFFPPKEFKDVDEWVLGDPEAIRTLKELV